MKKINSLLPLIIFLMAFFFIPKSVLADGMIIEPHPYFDRWDYSNENNQKALINYDSGLQKMIISVGLKEKNSNGAIWLFPVPSEPDNIVIDVVKILPELGGKEISKKTKENLDNTLDFLQITQLYTIPFVLFNNKADTSEEEAVKKNLGELQSLNLGSEKDVVVYEHLEKEGVTSEIITAKTANGLYDYFQNKGLKIEKGSIPILDNYIGKEYSFVASWIISPEKIISAEDIKNNLNLYFFNKHVYPEFATLIDGLKQKYPELNQSNDQINYLKSLKGEAVFQELVQAIQSDPSIIEDDNIEQKGVFVTFPTKEIYFPLLPTSVYGSKTVPATIRVIGHVTPKIFQNIKSYTKIEYYIDGHMSLLNDLKTFYNGKDKNIKYTKIEINAPSKFFTDDLWLKNKAPVKTYFLTFFAKHPIAITLIILILSSVLAGILAGMIIFKDLRKNPVKLGLIGLSNLLTICGLLITTVLVGTKNKNENIEPILAEIRQKGYLRKRRVVIILSFLLIPILLLLIFGLLLTFSLNSNLGNFIMIFIICVLPITALILCFTLKRIKPEDKNLFEQLKLSNYSSWSFQLKDKSKIIFIPVFSAFFLTISWLVVKLIGLII